MRREVERPKRGTSRRRLPLVLAVAAGALTAGAFVAPRMGQLWAQAQLEARGLASDGARDFAAEQRIRGAQVVDASCARRIEDVTLLLRAGYPAYGRSYNHDLSALHCAAFWGEVELIRDLVARGSVVDGRSEEDGIQPIHLAAANGQLQAVRVLHELGAAIDAPSVEGTPLLLAFSDGATSRLLPSRLSREIRAAIGEGQKPTEARARDLALLGEFVTLGAQLDATNQRGETLLHLAIDLGDVALVAELLKRGLDVRAKDAEGRTPLLRAARTAAGNAKAVKHHLLRALLDAGAEVNDRDASGVNAFCAILDEPEALAVLLEAGLDPNVADPRGTSCWSGLRRNLVPEEIMAIAERIPNLRTPILPDGSPGAGPLLAFARDTEEELVRYFLRRGLRPIERGNGGYGVMHAALGSSGGVGDHEAARERIVRMLIDANADLGERTDRGETPLMMARSQPASLIRLVIASGADVNAVNSSGQSVLDVFERSRNADGIAVLRAAGARTGAEMGTAPRR